MPPPFPVWICSVQAQGQRQPRYSPASREPPLRARRDPHGQEGDHRLSPAPLNPSCIPKGHKLFLYPCGVEEQLKSACAVPEPQGRGAERGSPCSAALQPPRVVGVQWDPGTRKGSGVQTPPAPCQLVPAAGSQWTNTRVGAAPWESPKFAPRVLGYNGGPRGGGGNGRRYPPRLLTLPMWSSTDSTSCSEQHVPPISSLRAVMGKGEAEQSHAARPPEPPRTPRCAQHRRAPSPGSGEALRISQMLLFPRQELRSRLLPTPRLAHRSPSRG